MAEFKGVTAASVSARCFFNSQRGVGVVWCGVSLGTGCHQKMNNNITPIFPSESNTPVPHPPSLALTGMSVNLISTEKYHQIRETPHCFLHAIPMPDTTRIQEVLLKAKASGIPVSHFQQIKHKVPVFASSTCGSCASPACLSALHHYPA